VGKNATLREPSIKTNHTNIYIRWKTITIPWV